MSENDEETDDYAAQDLEIMNTMEATNNFCLKHMLCEGHFFLF